MGIKYFFIFYFVALVRVLNANDTTIVSENLWYVINIKIIDLPICKDYENIGIVEFQIDSIIYYKDTTVFKSEYHFKKNARFLVYPKDSLNLKVGNIYTVKVSLLAYYSVFQLTDIYNNKLIVIEDSHHIITSYDPNYKPKFSYTKSKFKDFYNRLIYSKEKISFLPIEKRYLKRKYKPPKYLECLKDYKVYIPAD